MGEAMKPKRKPGKSRAFEAPYKQPPYTLQIRAENCDGSKPDYLQVTSVAEDARKHADWLHNDRSLMNVVIDYPPYTGPKVAPTEQDMALGHALAEVLDNRTVKPSAKMDINLWLDSKEWP